MAVLRGPSELLRMKLVHELHGRFDAQKFSLTLAEARAELGCRSSEDCRPQLGVWLSRARPVDFIIHPRERSACMPQERCTRWLVIYDVRCERVLEEVAYTEAPGDKVLPLTTAREVARALQGHVRALRPRAADEPGSPEQPRGDGAVVLAGGEFTVCLSFVAPDYSEHRPPGYPSRGTRCDIGDEEGDGPAGLLPAAALVGVGLRRRRRQALERLADSGALPSDVVARLRERG